SDRAGIPFYGSGLFIGDDLHRLKEQVERFRHMGMKHYKMKIGTGADEDLRRVQQVRELIGQEGQLYVDANGAYGVKQALELAWKLGDYGVSWFEEPISSDDIDGLVYLREHFPAHMDLVAGEYCYQLYDFLRLLSKRAVDILQLDATRCGGVSGALRAAAL